ncbi:MAG: NAD(P)-binding protein [Coriobacteriales bacterium]|jgi:NADPH-dependent glutamate synthase beta subunit-like oxidoreductase
MKAWEMHMEGLNAEQGAVAELQKALGERFIKSTLSPCPVEFTAAFVNICNSQSCGKCTPCRVGLQQLHSLIEDILSGKGTQETLKLIEKTARDISLTADCAIGSESAALALEAIRGFRKDFNAHIEKGYCEFTANDLIPCMSNCPARVDIPGYIALVEAGRYTDAVRLIRKDNPLPISCGSICEHPCEINCRRGMLDDPINIRGLKRYACDHQTEDYEPYKYPPTGKKVAIIGGGPAGLTAAYYLTIMGHSCTIYEQRSHLGGMMRYGIPNYRFDKDLLEEEVQFIIRQGIEVKTNVIAGYDISIEELRENYDAMFIAIGAHDDRQLHLVGESAPNVMSAVQMLRDIGEGIMPDFTDQTIVIVGGGNVAMDVARSSVRLGAKRVIVVYRRRMVDMTAQNEEIMAALAEGCEIMELHNPIGLELDRDHVTGVKIQPQIVGELVGGRPSIRDAKADPFVIDCDRVVVAIGQNIDSRAFADYGIPTNRGKIVADAGGAIEGFDGIFSGGDCSSGPATVIKAIAAGKAVARNIDNYLGYNHVIKSEVEIPPVKFKGRISCARSEMNERGVEVRRHDFEMFEEGLTDEAAQQESNRCLHCDHFGFGAFRGGRIEQW